VSASSVLKKTITDAVNSYVNIWKGSVFEPMQTLSVDACGRWGEDFLNEILVSYGFKVKWSGDKNTNAADGKYDIVVNDNRVEVKTSFRNRNTSTGKHGGWQHENIYKAHVWDKIIFIDVDVNGIYITVLNFNDIVFKKDHPHKILKRTPCLRKNRDDGYKFDFGLNTVEYGVKGGLTYYWDLKDEKGLRKFLTEKFS